MRHSTAEQETCPLQGGWPPSCWSVFLIVDFTINAVVKEIDIFLSEFSCFSSVRRNAGVRAD